MTEKLVNLHNNLMQVEVKGESALILANCIYELRAMINEQQTAVSTMPAESEVTGNE